MGASVISGIAKIFGIKTYISLRLFNYSGVYWTILITMELVLLYYIMSDRVYCIKDSEVLDPEASAFEAQFGRLRLFYAFVTCGTEIRYQGIMLYIFRVAYIVMTSSYILHCNKFIEKLNRDLCITTQQRIEKFIGDEPVLKDKDYFGDLVRHGRELERFMRWSLPSMIAVWISITVATYTRGECLQILLPYAKMCSSEWVFNRPRDTLFRCHFEDETLIFVVAIAIEFGRLGMLGLMVLTYAHYSRRLLKQWNNLEKQLPKMSALTRGISWIPSDEESDGEDKKDKEKESNLPNKEGASTDSEMSASFSDDSGTNVLKEKSVRFQEENQDFLQVRTISENSVGESPEPVNNEQQSKRKSKRFTVEFPKFNIHETDEDDLTRLLKHKVSQRHPKLRRIRDDKPMKTF